MQHPLSQSVSQVVSSPVLNWQDEAKRSGLYSSLQNYRLGLQMKHAWHITKIMPHSSLNLKNPEPAEVDETSALIFGESAKDLGRNDNIGHALLITINKEAPGNYYVELFDSANKKISRVIKQLLIDILPPDSRVCVHHVPVQNQGQTMNCAYFALAFLTHLCLGLRQELDTVVFDVSQMHGHLEECCKEEFVTEFPTVKDEKNLKIQEHGRTLIPDHLW